VVRPNSFAAPGTVTYNITRVPPTEANAVLLERLWRGHWTISQSHYVQDVTLGEDRNHIVHGPGTAGVGGVAQWAAGVVAAGRMDEHRKCGAGTCGIGATRTGIHRRSGNFDVALSPPISLTRVLSTGILLRDCFVYFYRDF
jgi:hypothetical protein